MHMNPTTHHSTRVALSLQISPKHLHTLNYCNICIHIIIIPGVGYTMSDIRYFWRDGLSSVGMSSEVELPQFRVLGHKQKSTEINLTTGIAKLFQYYKQVEPHTHTTQNYK